MGGLWLNVREAFVKIIVSAKVQMLKLFAVVFADEPDALQVAEQHEQRHAVVTHVSPVGDLWHSEHCKSDTVLE